MIEAVEACLVEKHIGVILQKGFDALLEQDRLEDLSRLYGLCARVHALDALCAAFRAHVRRVGGALVMDQEKDPEMVEALLTFKTRMDAVLVKCFHSNESFTNSLKDGTLFFCLFDFYLKKLLL